MHCEYFDTTRNGKGGSKSDFCFFFNTIQNESNKVCTKLLCVKAFSGKVVAQPFSYLTVHTYFRET